MINIIQELTVQKPMIVDEVEITMTLHTTCHRYIVSLEESITQLGPKLNV